MQATFVCSFGNTNPVEYIIIAINHSTTSLPTIPEYNLTVVLYFFFTPRSTLHYYYLDLSILFIQDVILLLNIIIIIYLMSDLKRSLCFNFGHHTYMYNIRAILII